MAFQNITPAKLGQSAATTGNTVLYTTPALTRTFVKDIDICNTTPAPILVRIFLVPSAGSPAAGNAIAYDWLVAALSTVQWAGSQLLYAGDTIQIRASAPGVTVTASGGEAV